MSRMRIVAIGAGLLLSVTVAAPLSHAQVPPPSGQATGPALNAGWSALASAARQEVEVLTIDGNLHKGQLRLVTDEGITLAGGRPFPRDEVWQVWDRGKPSWAKRGFWIGFAAGIALVIVDYNSQGDCADPTSACAQDGYFSKGDAVGTACVAGPMIGGLGALLGRWIGGRARDPQLLYTGPTRGAPPPRAADKRP
jgi:hypothetical protein